MPEYNNFSKKVGLQGHKMTTDAGNLELKSKIPDWFRMQTEYNKKRMQNARMPQFSQIRLACQVDKMTKFKLNSRSIQNGSIWMKEI